MSDAKRGEIGVLDACAVHLDLALRTDLHRPVGSGACCGGAASYAAAPAARMSRTLKCPGTCRSRTAGDGRERERSPAPDSSQTCPAAVMHEAGCETSTASDFRLLGDLKGVIYLDAEIPYGRLQLGVPQEQLHCTQVLGAPIDQRRLGPAHRMRPVVCAV